jgi:hypothetical protein
VNTVERFEPQRVSIYPYRGLDLEINADDVFKCIPRLIERLADELLASIEIHGKVMLLRIDLHVSENEHSNEPVADLLRWLKQVLKRDWMASDTGHVWSRDYGKSKGLHWHLVLMLNGNRIRNSYAITDRIKAYWHEQRGFGEVKIPHNCYTHIKGVNNADFMNGFYRASYLTKERSKFVGKHRAFGSSSLANKMKNNPNAKYC